jgi:hypothetical protein
MSTREVIGVSLSYSFCPPNRIRYEQGRLVNPLQTSRELRVTDQRDFVRRGWVSLERAAS